ncbi:MAG: dTDP-4-dehydrorhamnose reductase [Acidobacteria bacterium]|nr:dTDP-4-dehydrorhamnose reductase [Acidobacteriota bacterium]
MRVLVTGAGGLVGRAVSKDCRTHGDEVFALDHQALDIASAELVERELERIQPDAVINCAAWTDVDGCERDHARAQAANADGPENLARASRTVDAVFVTISTDYVFDGEKDGFYTQDDEPNPKSIYGLVKLAGERQAQRANARTIVVRSGFIFGPGGRNFLSTVGERLRRQEQVSAIADAWGTPTYAIHLAARLRELVLLDLPGTYHVVNSGDGAAYDEFARAVGQELGKDQSLVQSVLSSALKRPAPRPRNSRLRCLISEARGLSPLPPWRDGIRQFLSPDRSSQTAT